MKSFTPSSRSAHKEAYKDTEEGCDDFASERARNAKTLRAYVEEDCLLLRQALFQSIKEEEWIDMHEQLKEDTRQVGVQKSSAEVLTKVARTGLQQKVGPVRKSFVNLKA